MRKSYLKSFSVLLAVILGVESTPLHILADSFTERIPHIIQEPSYLESVYAPYYIEEDYEDEETPITFLYEDESGYISESPNEYNIDFAGDNNDENDEINPQTRTGDLVDAYSWTSNPWMQSKGLSAISGEEEVSLNNGELIYHSTDYVIKGRGGLDLVIGRIYHSQQAYSEIPMVDAAYQDWSDFPDMYNVTRFNSFYNDMYGLGLGWEFNFTSLEKSIYSRSAVLHLGRGDSYCIEDLSTPIDMSAFGGVNVETSYQLKDYKLEDIHFVSKVGDFYNGVEKSYFTVKYSDGKREYLSRDGRLIGIVDRFGNTIKLCHNGVGYLGTTITDTVGHTITISSSNTSSGHQIIISLPESVTLKYNVEHNSFNSNHWELSSYINAKGNYTSYLYTRRNSRFDFFSKNNPNTNQFA